MSCWGVILSFQYSTVLQISPPSQHVIWPFFLNIIFIVPTRGSRCYDLLHTVLFEKMLLSSKIQSNFKVHKLVNWHYFFQVNTGDDVLLVLEYHKILFFFITPWKKLFLQTSSTRTYIVASLARSIQYRQNVYLLFMFKTTGEYDMLSQINIRPVISKAKNIAHPFPLNSWSLNSLTVKNARQILPKNVTVKIINLGSRGWITHL